MFCEISKFSWIIGFLMNFRVFLNYRLFVKFPGFSALEVFCSTSEFSWIIHFMWDFEEGGVGVWIVGLLCDFRVFLRFLSFLGLGIVRRIPMFFLDFPFPVGFSRFSWTICFFWCFEDGLDCRLSERFPGLLLAVTGFSK